MKLFLATSLVVPVLSSGTHAQVTQRVSLDSAGGEAYGEHGFASISIDGRFVVFESLSTELVPMDTNGARDVFLRDRQAGSTTLVSVNLGGTVGNGLSERPRVSGNGQYVCFSSWASNLVTGDTNGRNDVFLRDMQSLTTELISKGLGGMPGDGTCNADGITPDGRHVSFSSSSTNLVLGDANGDYDTFVFDRTSGTIERVSVGTAGTEAAGGSAGGSLSSDGRFVAFSSDAPNLVPGDTNAARDIFVRDRQNGTTERVTMATVGSEANASSYKPEISGDGRFVVFESLASNLVSVDTNGTWDVFLHDRQTGTTERISLAFDGSQPNNRSSDASVSGDGRYVVFESDATNVVPNDTNARTDVFVRDRQLGTIARVSVSSTGSQASHHSFSKNSGRLFSGDGRYVAFHSYANNLVPLDTNITDVFVRDQFSGTTSTSMCNPGVGGVIGCPCGQPANPTGGCANHGAGSTNGAVLGASGGAYLSCDSLLLTTTNHRSLATGVLNVFFSYKPGTISTGAASGAGISCADPGGSLKRLYTMQVFGGSGSKPGMGDPSVSARSATFSGHAITPGETRFYFNVYRDGQASGPCGDALVSTNLTNMGAIAWSP